MELPHGRGCGCEECHPRDSFFNIFNFGHMMHDAIDGGLTYEDCTIERDLELPNGIKLKKGTWFETVYLILKEAVFEFCNWEADPNKSWVMNPTTKDRVGFTGSILPASVTISQSMLAPYCHWEETDQEYWASRPDRFNR